MSFTHEVALNSQSSKCTEIGKGDNQCVVESLSASGDSELARGAAITFRLRSPGVASIGLYGI